jgi:hypothetical protein
MPVLLPAITAWTLRPFSLKRVSIGAAAVS